VADERAATPSAAAELVSPDAAHFKRRLEHVCEHMTATFRYYLSDLNNRLNWLTKSLRHPQHKLQEQAQTLDHLQNQLQKTMMDFLKKRQQALALLAGTLHAYSPLLTLSRGYAIVKQGEKVISGIEEIQQEKSLKIEFKNGSALCQVSSLLPSSPI
jgi:exodeoxyribonuclease VII large subunit